VSAHWQAILRHAEWVKLHKDEARVEHEKVRTALAEANKALAAATDDAAKLDISRRTVMLAQRFKLLGGDLHELEGHAGQRWTQPWKGSHDAG
jgi:hypothetical protein